jgi:signal transduction histidine kinase
MTVTDSLAGTVMAKGDENWTRQVLSGLILNAVRHAREGDRLVLRTEVGPDGPWVHVIDNGPGIPEEVQSQVFDRFSQGVTPQRGEGFGIGLAFAKWVVERQGGTISVTSPVPDSYRLGEAEGTMVSVGIPAASD